MLALSPRTQLEQLFTIVFAPKIKSVKINLGRWVPIVTHNLGNQKVPKSIWAPPPPKYRNEKVFFSGMGSLNQSSQVVLTNRTILSLSCLLTQHYGFHRIRKKEMLAAIIEDADLSNASKGKLWVLDQIQGSEISLNAFFLHFDAVFRGKIGVAFYFTIVYNANCFISYLYTWILNILKQIFNQLRFSLGTFVSKRKTENIPTASIDWERSNQAVAEYLWIFFANICHF